MVVVTRWYGGIKLGAGGLARAYGGTAAQCLRLGERTPIVAMARFETQCAFADLALLTARLRELGAQVERETFGADGVTQQWSVAQDRVAEVQARVLGISRGRGEVRRLD